MLLNATDKGDKDTQASECVSGLTTARRRSGGDVLVRGGVLPELHRAKTSHGEMGMEAKDIWTIFKMKQRNSHSHFAAASLSELESRATRNI